MALFDVLSAWLPGEGCRVGVAYWRFCLLRVFIATETILDDTKIDDTKSHPKGLWESDSSYLGKRKATLFLLLVSRLNLVMVEVKVPIYEYECKSCGHQLEALQKMSDDPLQRCPACEKDELKKLISAAAFRLKGDGWYETDFKSGKKKNLAGGDSKSKGTDSGTSKSQSSSKSSSSSS